MAKNARRIVDANSDAFWIPRIHTNKSQLTGFLTAIRLKKLWKADQPSSLALNWAEATWNPEHHKATDLLPSTLRLWSLCTTTIIYNILCLGQRLPVCSTERTQGVFLSFVCLFFSCWCLSYSPKTSDLIGLRCALEFWELFWYPSVTGQDKAIKRNSKGKLLSAQPQHYQHSEP